MTIEKLATEQNETHIYAIPGMTPPGRVEIRFRNGQFDRAIYPFHGHYSREQWAILKQIAEEIEALARYA